MDPGPNQPTPPPPPPADVEDIELQVLPAAAPTIPEPPPGNADPDGPEENEVDAPVPLGVKLTAYRLLNLVIILALGLAKFILSLKGQAAAPTGLEWVAGSVFAALSYWIGLYELVQPPRWEWLLHVDLAPAIGFILKCFLGGVLQAFALYWEMLPFCLFIGIPLLVLSRITASPTSSNQQSGLDLLFSWLLVAFLIFLLPEKWRVWKRIWVWGPAKRFFRKYGSNYPKRRRYRLWGKAGFILGLLSGMFLVGLLPTVLVLRYLQNRSRPPLVDISS